jgi:hypothetical protein
LLLIRSSSILRLRFALILALVLLAPGLAVPAAAQSEQESEQEGESGETDQSGEVLNEGDNSNQCVAVQPVSNTGNAITDIDIILELPTGQDVKRFNTQDVLDLIDELDLDLEDVGSTIELSPEQAVECAQAVDQAATAASEEDEPPAEDVSGQDEPVCAPEWRQEWYPDWASGWWYFYWFQDCYTDQQGWYRVYDGWDWGPSIW